MINKTTPHDVHVCVWTDDEHLEQCNTCTTTNYIYNTITEIYFQNLQYPWRTHSYEMGDLLQTRMK